MVKKALLIGALLIIGCIAVVRNGGFRSTGDKAIGRGTDQSIATAFQNHASNIQVAGEGIVIKLLADDLQKPRHQRFILRLESGQTLLVAHNIDVAPRIEGLEEGDRVEFNGEYEWSDKGGVIHWTHRDPGRQRIAGWLKHRGQTYQ